MKVARLVVAVAIACAVFAPKQAQATSIRLLTGVDASNTVLADGALDPFWTISTDGGSTFVAARVLYDTVVASCSCGMDTEDPQARWISDPSTNDAGPGTAWGIGNTVYARRTFDLTGFDLPTTDLSGIWRVADNRLGIYLNGTLIDPATADGAFGFQANQAFALAAGSGLFLSGLNTLELRGNSVNSVWDGFWLDATVSDQAAPVPEPASLLLLGTGLVAAGSRRWWKRQPKA